MKIFSKNKMLTAMIAIGFAANVYAQDGISDTTGYANNYAATGSEMTIDLAKVNWNVVKVDTAKKLKKALSKAKPGDKIVIAAGTYKGTFKLTVGGLQKQPIWIMGENSKNMPVLDGTDFNNKIVLSINGIVEETR